MSKNKRITPITTENVLSLEISKSDYTSKRLVVTGGIYEPDKNFPDRGELIALEMIIHNSISQNEINNALKNDSLKIFKDFQFDRNLKIIKEKKFTFTTSLLERVGEKNLDYPKGFKKQLWIHSFAGNKSVSLETLYFIVPKNIEDKKQKKQFLKEIFKNKILKKLPLPIKEEWFSYLWEEIEEYFIPLVTFGLFNYEGYSLRLPFDKLQRAVTNIQAKMEWKRHFKRVPKFKPLLQIMDIPTFNFKEWQKFYKEYVSEIESYPLEIQEDIIRAWELFGNEKAEWIIKNKDFIHGISWKIPQVTIRLQKDKNKKQQIKKMFQEGFEYFYDQTFNEEHETESDFIEANTKLQKFINLFEILIKEQFNNLKNKNYNAIEKFIKNYTYTEIEEGCESLAKECARCGVPENHYKDYEEWWINNIEDILTSPREYPTISGKIGKYTWKMADMSDPQAWVAGLDTYCCQHFHSVGGACVEYAILNPHKSGIFMVQKSNTIAQSFMWLSDFKGEKDNLYRILVFDNIEVAGNEFRAGIAYKDFLDKLEKYAKFFRIKAVTIGTGYSDIDIEKAFNGKLINNNHKFYAPIPAELKYTDANKQVLVHVYDW